MVARKDVLPRPQGTCGVFINHVAADFDRSLFTMESSTAKSALQRTHPLNVEVIVKSK